MSQSRLWYFNPENDLALASGTDNYTPPPAAIELRRAGEILPLWLASEGDRVLCSGINDAWLADIQKSYGLTADVWNHEPGLLRPSPWGWSLAARRYFCRLGFDADALPSDVEMDCWRQLSRRETGADVSHRLALLLPEKVIWPAAEVVKDVAMVKSLIAEYGEVAIKAPWSSSGRGVKFFDRTHSEQAAATAAGFIRKQGACTVERRMAVEREFALLYHYTGGRAQLYGYSCFASDARGQYAGNRVASSGVLSSDIAATLPGIDLPTLEQALSKVLEEQFGHRYEGPLGVDFLIGSAYDTPGRQQLHLSEINLRYTMGFIAAALAPMIEGEGRFEVLPATDKRLAGYAARKPRVCDGRLVAGVQWLTPPGAGFAFLLESSL